MEDINLTDFAIAIIVLGIVVSIGAVIMINYQSAVVTTNSKTSTITTLQDNGTSVTLDGTPTSISTTAHNNSWMEFDG